MSLTRVQQIVLVVAAFALLLPLWFAVAPYPGPIGGRCPGALWVQLEGSSFPRERCFDADDRLRTAVVLAAAVVGAAAFGVWVLSPRDDDEDPDVGSDA